MNKEALYSDGTGNYINPAEPQADEILTIRFRTAKNDADEVWLVTEKSRYLMHKEVSRGLFDYYTVNYQLGKDHFRYCFEIKSGSEHTYYQQCGPSEKVIDDYYFMIAPGFSTPEWAKGAVMYQIYVDRFCNGTPDNDVETGEYMYLGDKSIRVKDLSLIHISEPTRP